MDGSDASLMLLHPIAGQSLSWLALLLLFLFVLTFSSYIKIVTVLGIVRMGLGFEGLPAAFVTGGLAITLSFLVMLPTMQQSSRRMEQSLGGKVETSSTKERIAAFEAASVEWKNFVLKHSSPGDIEKFRVVANSISARTQPATTVKEPVLESWQVLAPAFFVTQIKAAFATGLSLLLPFLIVDLLVAHVLAAIGLTTLSASTVSFPFKLLLFVLVDGWGLITTNLVGTFVT